MEITSWLSQLRKGAAELVVLSVVARRALYGLEILDAVNMAGGIVSGGALYPLLNRLEREGKLVSEWIIEDPSPPRKYYRLTPEGAAVRAEMVSAWTSFRKAMSDIVEDEK